MDGARAAADSPDQAAERPGPRFRSIDVGQAMGRYQLVEELGMGGMATVYRARDIELRRDVAVKVLFPHLSKRRDIVARFQREARAAAALDHPNIVRVYDVGGGQPDAGANARNDARPDARPDAAADAGSAPGAPGEARSDRLLDPPYIVMELVRGRSLQEFVQAHAEPPLAEVVAGMGVVLCAALAEAHRAGVVHRDIKPANIMVTDGGRLALADFGVARIEDEDSSLVTRTGALLGTPAFMSPEQAMGSELDARSDIFSLGATLYRMATGAAPFAGSTARVVTAIATGEIVPPLRRNPAMGKELARVIERMMAQQPGARFQSAAEAAEALRRIATRTGLGEPAAELEAFFADPAGHTARRTPEVARATLELSRQAARERALPRAMALADRVLALVPEGPEASEALALVDRLGQGRRRARWLLAGSAALGVTAVIAAGAWWTGWRASALAPPVSGDAGPDTAVAAADLPDASTADASSAARSALALAGRDDAGAAEPRENPGPVAGRGPRQGSGHSRQGSGHSRQGSGHSRQSGQSGQSGSARALDQRVSGRDGQADVPEPGKDGGQQSSAMAPAGRPDAGVAEARPATLTLDMRPWCDVRIDGKDHGRASRDRVITLPPGRHEVVCTQGPGRAEWRRTLILKPGQRLDLSGSVLGAVRVTIAVKRGDRVVIEGRRHDNGATIALPPGRYRMEVRAGSARVGSGWVSVPVVASCALRDQPALDCYP